jgi:hypothetical protein
MSYPRTEAGAPLFRNRVASARPIGMFGGERERHTIGIVLGRSGHDSVHSGYGSRQAKSRLTAHQGNCVEPDGTRRYRLGGNFAGRVVDHAHGLPRKFNEASISLRLSITTS